MNLSEPVLADMRKEAVNRMKLIELDEYPIQKFENEGKVMVSIGGEVYFPGQTIKDRIRQFEEEYNMLVYHVIENFTKLGHMVAFLYVDTNTQEYQDARRDLLDTVPIGYVANLTDEICSEFGSIPIKVENGKLYRVG